ncbi:MAG: hypothetical protein AAGJ80_12345, partial [Cyanobacteria bacterium J06553_1]
MNTAISTTSIDFISRARATPRYQLVSLKAKRCLLASLSLFIVHCISFLLLRPPAAQRARPASSVVTAVCEASCELRSRAPPSNW